MVNIQHLYYYLEIIERKSISAAAKSLNVSQPLLTRIVKSMEEEFKVTLIHRTTRQFVLTEAGVVLKDYAERILQDYTDMANRMDNIIMKPEGKVKIGATSTVLECYFQEILFRILQKYPLINITITEETAKAVSDSIIEGTQDLGITMLPIKETHLIETNLLLQDSAVAVVNNQHPFAGKKLLSISDLKKVPLVTFNDSTVFYDGLYNACDHAGFIPNVQYSCNSIAFNISMVASSPVVGIMPRPLVEHYMKDNIVCIPLKSKIDWNIAVAYRKGGYISFATQCVFEEICKFFDINTVI